MLPLAASSSSAAVLFRPWFAVPFFVEDLGVAVLVVGVAPASDLRGRPRPRPLGVLTTGVFLSAASLRGLPTGLPERVAVGVAVADVAVDFLTPPLPFGLPRGRPLGTLVFFSDGSLRGRPRPRLTPSVGAVGAILRGRRLVGRSRGEGDGDWGCKVVFDEETDFSSDFFAAEMRSGREVVWTRRRVFEVPLCALSRRSHNLFRLSCYLYLKLCVLCMHKLHVVGAPESVCRWSHPPKRATHHTPSRPLQLI